MISWKYLQVTLQNRWVCMVDSGDVKLWTERRRDLGLN